MKRFLCLIFTALTLLSLTVPIVAGVPDYENLPPLDMDNTTIEYDFENVFFNDYQLEDFKYNPEKSGVEFITMAEKGYSKSKNLFDLSKERYSGYAVLISRTENEITLRSSSSYYHFSIPIPNWQILLNKTVTISCKYSKTGDYLRPGIRILGFNGTSASIGTTEVSAIEYDNSIREGTLVATKTITKIPDLEKYPGAEYCLSIYSNCQGAVSDEEAKNEEITYYDIQIEIGDTKTEYEAYGISSNYSQYFYLYNPSRLKIVKDSAYNIIQFGSNVTGGIKTDPRYKQHKLKLVDTYGATDESGDFTDALILKYTLVNYDNFIYDENFKTRFYDVSGIELLLEGEATSKEYGVAKVFEFYDSPLGLPVCTVQSTNVIRLDELAFSYYRVESEIKNHYKDIQSVSFSIPNDFINKYGELTQLHAVWEECLTQPVLIVNNADVLDEFEKVLNKEVPSDFKYSFGYETIFDDFDLRFSIYQNYFYTFNYQFNSNINLSDKDIYPIALGEYDKVSIENPYNNLIDKLYFVEYSKDVFDPNVVCVTSEKMMQNLDNYLWADEVFTEIDDTNFDLQNPKLFDVTYLNELGTYRAPTLWESIFKAGGNSLIKDDGNPIIYSSIETINKSYLTDKDNDDLFAERYKVYKDDVDDIKAVSSDNSTTYIVRYAVTDYIVNQAFIYEEGSDKPVCDAIVGQAEAIRNFDFIDMYFTKDEVVTCFAVGMDKQNFISDYTGVDVKYTPDRWAELLAFLEKCFAIAIVFTILSIALKLFTLFKRTKVKVVINERRRK